MLGGRQFARLWHFAFMLALLGFFAIHMVLVATGRRQSNASMITGWYPSKHDGVGP